jgi:hypothetical protein
MSTKPRCTCGADMEKKETDQYIFYICFKEMKVIRETKEATKILTGTKRMKLNGKVLNVLTFKVRVSYNAEGSITQYGKDDWNYLTANEVKYCTETGMSITFLNNDYQHVFWWNTEFRPHRKEIEAVIPIRPDWLFKHWRKL